MKPIHRSVIALLLVLLSSTAFAKLHNEDIVLRAGNCSAQKFTSGAERVDTQDKLYGLSVFVQEGVRTSKKIHQITSANPGLKAKNGGCWTRTREITRLGGSLRKAAEAGKPDHYLIDGLTVEQLRSIFEARWR